MHSEQNSRRTFLRALSALGIAGAGGWLPDVLAATAPDDPSAAAPHDAASGHPGGLKLGPAADFSFAGLIDRAERMARRPYQSPPKPAQQAVAAIDYDAQGKIHFNDDDALWKNGPSVYPITFRPLGKYFPKSVEMHVIDGDHAREIRYQPDYFQMPADSPLHQVPSDQSAISGFWVQRSRRIGDWTELEPWATFQGASYFRAISRQGQVGMSARGIAVNTGMTEPEEFPDFRAFWFEAAKNEGDPVVVYALLDGPSITGAYRFELRFDGNTEMTIEKHLFIRKTIDRLGIAPLTSMYWYSETPNSHVRSWRPEVHDSDTLSLWRGSGDRAVRPLANPDQLAYSAFADHNPRGYGLDQRDRNPDHYLDGVGYEKRPSVWVQPLGDWGDGNVTLIEIPTDDETMDNIVAFWQPKGPALAGSSMHYRYRLYWVEHQPFFPTESLARAVALRAGPGGNMGQSRPANTVKLLVEWAGPMLAGMAPGQARFEVQTTRGQVDNIRIDRVAGTTHWISQFDLAVDGDDPVELRGKLTLNGKTIGEDWLYQFHRTSFQSLLL